MIDLKDFGIFIPLSIVLILALGFFKELGYFNFLVKFFLGKKEKKVYQNTKSVYELYNKHFYKYGELGYDRFLDIVTQKRLEESFTKNFQTWVDHNLKNADQQTFDEKDSMFSTFVKDKHSCSNDHKELKRFDGMSACVYGFLHPYSYFTDGTLSGAISLHPYSEDSRYTYTDIEENHDKKSYFYIKQGDFNIDFYHEKGFEKIMNTVHKEEMAPFIKMTGTLKWDNGYQQLIITNCKPEKYTFYDYFSKFYEKGKLNEVFLTRTDY